MKKVLIVAGLGVVVFLLYRVAQAAHAGTSAISALRHPTIDPRVAELVDHPERTQTRTGRGHF
jgi:hypothetical protein